MKKFFVLSIFFIFFVGCESLPLKKEKKEPSKSTPTLNQVFYGFPDLPIPKELTFEGEKSFIYETGSLKAGVLIFSGNVEVESLKNYFKTNMTRNGWRLINSFESKNVVLNFLKDDRYCNIHIMRTTFSTEVNIWIGPSDKGSRVEIEPK